MVDILNVVLFIAGSGIVICCHGKFAEFVEFRKSSATGSGFDTQLVDEIDNILEIQCMRECINHASCTLVSYNENIMTCQLGSGESASVGTSATDTILGWSTYQPYKVCGFLK